jgi:hypothetical protein
MEFVIDKTGTEMDCQYMKNMNEPFIIRETDSTDYMSAIVLLRNLGEKKDITSLEREALLSAVRLIKQKMDDIKLPQS